MSTERLDKIDSLTKYQVFHNFSDTSIRLSTYHEFHSNHSPHWHQADPHHSRSTLQRTGNPLEFTFYADRLCIWSVISNDEIYFTGSMPILSLFNRLSKFRFCI